MVPVIQVAILTRNRTFRTAPELFSQVYVYMPSEKDLTLYRMVTCYHACSSSYSKKHLSYMRMWLRIQKLCPNAYPNQLIIDFEKAAINSFEQVWPDTVMKYCFFYLIQNTWRKVQSKGMQSNYSQNEELAIRIRLLPALAFAVPHEVHHLFHSVVQQLPIPRQPVWSYISN